MSPEVSLAVAIMGMHDHKRVILIKRRPPAADQLPDPTGGNKPVEPVQTVHGKGLIPYPFIKKMIIDPGPGIPGTSEYPGHQFGFLPGITIEDHLFILPEIFTPGHFDPVHVSRPFPWKIPGPFNMAAAGFSLQSPAIVGIGRPYIDDPDPGAATNFE